MHAQADDQFDGVIGESAEVVAGAAMNGQDQGT
jgi:hypothetical protein